MMIFSLEKHVALSVGVLILLSPALAAQKPTPAPRYVCPVGADYTWYRLNVGVAVPVCPTHHVHLVQS